MRSHRGEAPDAGRRGARISALVLALLGFAPLACDGSESPQGDAAPNVRPDRTLPGADWRPEARFPVCPDGRALAGSPRPTFRCDTPPTATSAFYEEALRERGWTFVGRTRHGERRILVLRIQDAPERIALRRATLVVEPEEDGSRVHIYPSSAAEDGRGPEAGP